MNMAKIKTLKVRRASSEISLGDGKFFSQPQAPDWLGPTLLVENAQLIPNQRVQCFSRPIRTEAAQSSFQKAKHSEGIVDFFFAAVDDDQRSPS